MLLVRHYARATRASNRVVLVRIEFEVLWMVLTCPHLWSIFSENFPDYIALLIPVSFRRSCFPVAGCPRELPSGCPQNASRDSKKPCRNSKSTRCLKSLSLPDLSCKYRPLQSLQKPGRLNSPLSSRYHINQCSFLHHAPANRYCVQLFKPCN